MEVRFIWTIIGCLLESSYYSWKKRYYMYNVLTGWSTNNPSNVSVLLNFGYDIFSCKCRLVEKKPKYVIFEIWLISCVIYYIKLLYKLFSRRLIYGSLKIATITCNLLNINAFILFNYLSQQKMNYSTISNFMKSVNRRLVIHPSFFFLAMQERPEELRFVNGHGIQTC